MTAQLMLRFDNSDDLMRVLLFLRDSGLEKLVFQTKRPQKPQPKPQKRTWAFGIGNLQGRLDHINIRDYAYD